MTAKNNTVSISINLTLILVLLGILAGAYIGLLLSFDTQTHMHLKQFGRVHYAELFFTRFSGFMDRANVGPVIAFILGGGAMGGAVGLMLGKVFKGKS